MTVGRTVMPKGKFKSALSIYLTVKLLKSFTQDPQVIAVHQRTLTETPQAGLFQKFEKMVEIFKLLQNLKNSVPREVIYSGSCMRDDFDVATFRRSVIKDTFLKEAENKSLVDSVYGAMFSAQQQETVLPRALWNVLSQYQEAATKFLATAAPSA